MAYNIHHGEGMDEEIDLDRIAEFIRTANPDVIAIQEVDSMVDRTNRVDQASVLGKKTNMEPVFGAFMPYQGGQYGMAVLSKVEVVERRNIRLPDGDEPRTSVLVTARIPESGRLFSLAGIHFYRTEAERMAQAVSLNAELQQRYNPVFLVGDFNSTPGSAVMEYLDKEWQIVPKDGPSFTFPSYGPEREIDFILFRDDPRIEVLSHAVLDEPVISDHQPIVADVVIH